MTGTAPRIGPLARNEWTDEARDVFAYWEGPQAREDGSRSNTMMTLANHPPLALASLDLGKYFMLASTLTPSLLKTIVLRVAHRYGSKYQLAHNTLGARQIGMSDAEIAAIGEGADSPFWGDADRTVLTAIDQTCDGGKIDDRTWAQLSAFMDRKQIMDLVHAVGYFTMVAWGLVAMRVELEPDFAAFSSNRAKAD